VTATSQCPGKGGRSTHTCRWPSQDYSKTGRPYHMFFGNTGWRMSEKRKLGKARLGARSGTGSPRKIRSSRIDANKGREIEKGRRNS